MESRAEADAGGHVFQLRGAGRKQAAGMCEAQLDDILPWGKSCMFAKCPAEMGIGDAEVFRQFFDVHRLQHRLLEA